MAPKRKQANPKETASPATPGTPRRSPRLSGDDPSGTPRRSPRLSGDDPTPPLDDPQPRKRKKADTPTKIKEETETQTKTKEETEAPSSSAAEGPKTVVIEYCKQCNSFEMRANQVKVALERDIAGVKVVVNPEKPRWFEIREEGREVVVRLLDMKSPSQPLEDLDKKSPSQPLENLDMKSPSQPLEDLDKKSPSQPSEDLDMKSLSQPLEDLDMENLIAEVREKMW